MKATIFYHHHRRALKLSHEGVYIRFFWSGVPCMRVFWCNPGIPAPGHAMLVALFVGEKEVDTKYQWRPPHVVSQVYSETVVVQHPGPIQDILQIARFVAAGKTDPLLLLGWIEDNWEHPWSLLASPEPIQAIRALCPKPLSE